VVSIDYKSSQKQIQSQLTQLLVQVQSSTPSLSLDEIEKFILKIISEIEESQKRHEEINRKMNAQCVDEANFRNTEIRDGNQAYAASAEALAKCQVSLESANTNLPLLESAQATYVALLAQKTSERNKNHKIYLSLQKDWSEAITFLIDFNKQIIKVGTTHETGFSQMTENLIKHMTKVGKLKELAPIFIEITNTSTGDDSLAKLHNLVLDLQTQLSADMKFAQIEENKQIKIFTDLKTNLNDIVSQLKKNIDRTKSQIISMRLCVSKEKTIMYAASSKTLRNDRLLKLGDTACKDFARAFIGATKSRSTELVTIREIIEVIKKRFGQLDPDLLKRLKNMTVTLKVYINNTEFKKYESYVKTNVSDNASGRKLSNN
jgi:hypothetical protein